MDIEEMQTYRGYSITGSARPAFGRWSSMVTLRKALFRTEGISVCPLCDSPSAAVSQALVAARNMVDSYGFELYRLKELAPIEDLLASQREDAK